VIVNVLVFVPAATVTLAGTVATVVSELTRATPRPRRGVGVQGDRAGQIGAAGHRALRRELTRVAPGVTEVRPVLFLHRTWR